MAAEIVCKYWKFGHCKFKDKCRYVHYDALCNMDNCDVRNCSLRHPKTCRYFRNYGRCKYSPCSYSHDGIPSKEAMDEKCAEIEDLRKVIQNNVKAISNLEERILLLESQLSTSCRAASTSTQTTNMNSSFTSTSQSVIPQLDGLFMDTSSSELDAKEFTCETCGMNFTNLSDFKKHDALGFCCDECGICYSTQLAADLHELEVHPNTHYANTYIPESTKKIFANFVPPLRR